MELDFTNEIIEKLLFKQVLTDKAYLNICSSIFDKRWIKTPQLGSLINLVIKFYHKYQSVPSVKTLKVLFKRHLEKNQIDADFNEVNELIDSSVNLELDIDKSIISTNLKTFIRKQALWCSILDNVEDIEKNSDAVLEKCVDRFDKVSKITFNDTDFGMNYFSEEAMMSHWDYIKNPEAKIPTSLMGIDKYTNGGFLKSGKSLYIVMAQAGLGKSLMLSNLAYNFIKQNLSVVVISLEMSQDVYAMRFDAHISKNNINQLLNTSEDSISKIKDFYNTYPEANLYIKEYPPRSIKTSDIELYLENLKLAGKKIDVIIVDYLNLVLPDHVADNMYQGALNVSEKLRALSYKFNCPVITAVQANTEGMNNENIGMENISESRGIAHTADFIIGLYQMPEDRENSLIKGRILKNRLGGQVGKILTFKLNDENLILSDISFDSDMLAEMSDTDQIIKNLPSITDEFEDL